MALMAIVQNPLGVRLFINRGSRGWSERWPILEQDWDAGLDVAITLANARANLLSSDAQLEWACLFSMTYPYYEQAVIEEPLEPLPQWGPAIDWTQGLLWYFQTPDGNWSNHIFKAVDYTEIRNKEWVRTQQTIPFNPPALPTDLSLAPKQLLFENTLATFRKNVAFCRPMSLGRNGPGSGYWMTPYVFTAFNGVSSRRSDGRWRRMSWEGGNRNHCPDFSPCGMPTTVLRFSYQMPCCFGPGRSVTSIHYYDAQFGATVFPLKHIFWGRARALEIADWGLIGETRKEKSTDWCNGPAYGNAPGVDYTGTPSQFLGASSQSWPTGRPTPWGLRPACDEVVTQRFFPIGGLGMGGEGCEPVPHNVPVPVPLGGVLRPVKRQENWYHDDDDVLWVPRRRSR